METDRHDLSAVALHRAWAAQIPRADAAAVAATLRLRGDVRACFVGDVLWLRGDAFDETLDAAIRKLAPIARFFLNDDGRSLTPIGKLLPTFDLPQSQWFSLIELFEVERPVAAIPSPLPQRVSIRLIRSSAEQSPMMLRTRLADWVAYAENAPAVRLKPLRFAATSSEALIWGEPLPPLPGRPLWVRSGIAIPCGFDWSPPVDAVTLRRVLKLEEGDVALFHEDGNWDLVPAHAFVAARRSAVRETARGEAR